MGLSSAVLFIFLSLIIQSRANQEVKGQSKDFLPCDRAKVSGISRLELGKFVSAFRVTVVPSVVIPERLHSKILVCFHRNNALGLCQCKKDEWKAIQKGRWSSVMSPYEDRYVDVKFIDGVKGSVSVTLDEDSQQWRLFFLALGFVLLLLAPIVSGVPFYYTCSMDLGVFLVILSILFQGMKFLRTGRKKFLYFTIYDYVNYPTFFLKCQGDIGNVAYMVYDKKIKNPKLDFESSSFLLLGAGSFLLHHFSVMVNSIILHFGMPEEMYNPISVFLLVGIVLSGAFIGFWIVRKFISVAQFVKLAMLIIGTTSILECTLDTPVALGEVAAFWTLCSLIDSLKSGGVRNFIISVTVDGSVNAGVAQFVKWAMRIIGIMSILQCTLDTSLALGAVVACWTLCSLIHSLMSGGVRYQTFGFRNIWLWKNEQAISSAQGRRMLGSSNSRLALSDSTLQINTGMSRTSSGMQNQQEYYSTFHKLRNRKKFTKKEWDDLTKESPWEALAEWEASPECTDWIIEHADRIQLLPSESDSPDENAGGRASGFQLYNRRND